MNFKDNWECHLLKTFPRTTHVLNLEIFLFAQNSIGNYFELNLKFRNAPNASRLSEQIKLFEVKKKKFSFGPFYHFNIYISKASGSKEKQSSWTIFKHIRDSKGENMNI